MKRSVDEQYQDMVARLYPEITSSDPDTMSCMEITFQITDACSLACSYCYQINKGKRVMPFEIAKTFIDNLFAGKYSNYVSEEKKPFLILDFIGGEPFLQSKLIEQICDYFYDKAIELQSPWAEHSRISICTNGVHWFEPDVQHFIYKYLSKLSISITIDGDKELHDACRRFPDGRPSYDLAVAAAKDWISKGREPGSKITIAPANLQYLNKATKHFISLGYTTIHANVVYEKGWTIEHAQQFYKLLTELSDYLLDNNLEDEIFISLFEESLGKPKDEDDLQTWCGGVGNAMLAMDPEGYLYPCLRYMASSLGNDQEPIIIGDYINGIGVSDKQAQWIQCLGCVTRRSESTDECFYCPIADGCAECSAYNYQVNGTPDSRCIFICDMHKARVLANVYYWNKYYIKHNKTQRKKMHIPKEWALEIIDEDEYNMLLELAAE